MYFFLLLLSCSELLPLRLEMCLLSQAGLPRDEMSLYGLILDVLRVMEDFNGTERLGGLAEFTTQSGVNNSILERMLGPLLSRALLD